MRLGHLGRCPDLEISLLGQECGFPCPQEQEMGRWACKIHKVGTKMAAKVGRHYVPAQGDGKELVSKSRGKHKNWSWARDTTEMLGKASAKCSDPL